MARPWMSFYPADYLADTTHLTTIQHGAYLLLIMHYWQKGGLPDDHDQLARVARMSPEEWRENVRTLADFFQPGWVHKRVDAELATAESKYLKRAKAGRKGGRRAAMLKRRSSNASAMLHQPQLQPHTQLEKEGRKEEGFQMEDSLGSTHRGRVVAHPATRGGR